MLSIPFPIVIEDIYTTGSSAIDFLGSLSIALYDFFAGSGSSYSALSSVPFASLLSS